MVRIAAVPAILVKLESSRVQRDHELANRYRFHPSALADTASRRTRLCRVCGNAATYTRHASGPSYRTTCQLHTVSLGAQA